MSNKILEAECVLKDADRFKRKAQIGDKPFEWLKRAENLQAYFYAIATGTSAALITLIVAYMQMGTFAQVLTAIGLGPLLPWPLIVVIAVGTATGTFMTVKVVRRGREKVVEGIPRFVSCPLDALAVAVAEILLPPCVLATDQIKRVQDKLVKEWGYDRRYIEMLFRQIATTPDQFTIVSRAQRLRAMKSLMKHVQSSVLVTEIRAIASSSKRTDDPARIKLFETFMRYLENDPDITVETLRILEELATGRKIVADQVVKMNGLSALLRLFKRPKSKEPTAAKKHIRTGPSPRITRAVRSKSVKPGASNMNTAS